MSALTRPPRHAAGPALTRRLRHAAGPALTRRLRDDDRGAVATVFGVLLAGGVLLGMLALVIDVGRLYVEREELQTGADAAALAVARACADDLAACTDVERSTLAGEYAADRNAGDGAAGVTVCGSVPGLLDLVPCADVPAADNLTRCIGDPPAGGQPWLEVRTTTALADGSTLLPPTFAQTLLGNGGYRGATVGACARVSWGAPRAGLSVTFSRCEWNLATADGTDFPAAPPYPPNPVPADRYEVVLKLHDAQGNPACEQGPSGWDRPGGFGWLDDGSSSDCDTETFTADPGNNVPAPCLDLLDSVTGSAADARTLFVPIHDRVTGTGRNARYEIGSMEAFVPTGYFFGNGRGRQKASWLTGESPCTGQERCIFGYFVDVRVPGPVPIGDLDSVGATVITLIG
ncbi:TadE/TadG family type IV pilus assembly protein [Micromonospora cathayae]|uniref:Pilus assembly protein TadG-related protein n=1 Tax=Micromonospora cathayae TaxID=3028804 RepID=A0ABY7ZRM2_9ACTN|nr:pilus assembly protein TadG-related protein [Micromonospora sp. HUAS 3]WDZ85600.1 pilus assembly protein TadG-related protein [Micromonospora sp. HUAS 3]